MIVDVEKSARARIAAQFSQLVMLLADEPGLAAACSSALICDEPSVRVSRQRIHGELQRRVRTALRSGAWPEVAETLEFGLIGALVHASCGADTFRQTAEEVAGVVAVVLPEGALALGLTVDERDRLVERRPARTSGTHRDVLVADRHATKEDEPVRG